MKLPRPILCAILLVLFAAAFWIRVLGLSESAHSYFRGESGLHYRYAYMVGQKGRLPAIDKKASWPEGFVPSRVKATGAEFCTGYLFKIAGYFSDLNERQFARVLTALLFSILAIVMFGVSYHTWGCQAGALLSSSLIAFSAPLVHAFAGAYNHIPFAAVAVALHLLLLQRYLKKPSAWGALAMSLMTLALAAVWEGMFLYLAPAMLWAAAGKRLDHRSRLALFVPHLAAVVFAALLFHTLEYALGSHLSYMAYRVRYLFGKPDNPLLLPAGVRSLWTLERGYPAPYELLSMFLPLLCFIPPLAGGLRAAAKDGASRTMPVVVALILAAVYLVDRSMIVFATMGIAVLFAPALYAFSKHVGTRIVFVALGFVLLLTQAFQPHGPADLVDRAGRTARITPDGSPAFTWISIGNADIDLVQFLTTRTSTTDPFLSTPELSTLILTFAGRTTAIVPGIFTKQMAAKTGRLLGSLYEGEEELYAACRETGVTHVLYSIDMVLDESAYSPRYLAGAAELRRDCAAYRMHFFPEELARFELVFENDSYRVFEAAEHAGPLFMSDHPPVFQHEILARNRDTLASFYERIVRIMSFYALAAGAESRAEWDAALDLYGRCLDEAPRFTLARIGLGRGLTAQEKWDPARTAFQSVMQYAPDNAEALYGAAFAMYHLGELETARQYLNLLIATPGNSDLVKRARGLRMAIVEKMKSAG